jgi:signal transduction histidine kinase
MQTALQPSNPAEARDVLSGPPSSFVRQSWLEGGVAILDSSGCVVAVNEPLSHWLGRPESELVGQSFWETLGMISSDWKKSLLQISQSASPFERLNLKLSSPHAQSSQWFTLETARSQGNCFVRISSILPPLAELENSASQEHLGNEAAQRQTYVRLLGAEARLDGLTRRWPCVIFSQRPDFSMQFVSPNIEALTGIPAADWSGPTQRFWKVVYELDAAELQQQFKRAAQDGVDITNTYRIRHAVSGHVAYILEHRHPTISQNGLLLGYEVIWLDITRQTVAEKRLSSAAWKQTLAELTLGMAHDFRNIMAGIHSLSESFLLQIEERSPFKEGLTLIKNNSLQASQLVKRMINLHLGQTGERNYQDLNEITTDVAELVGKILPRHIRVETELAADSLPVYVDVVELRQVVINLLLNAADAMPQGGVLTLLTSRHADLPQLKNAKGTVLRLPCVCLTIEDTGCGIPERHLSSIFDPFFTTKSKGSGLGLYNARIALEKHQGAISVESKEGIGTSFHVWLPMADFSESDRDTATAQQQREAHRSILLLGQPGDTLDRTAEFLRSHNHPIVTAVASDSLPELLHSSDYHFAGAVLLAEPNAPNLYSMLAAVRQQTKGMKVALKLAGCNLDDLDSRVAEGVDLVLNSDVSHADVLRKLESFLR